MHVFMHVSVSHKRCGVTPSAFDRYDSLILLDSAFLFVSWDPIVSFLSCFCGWFLN